MKYLEEIADKGNRIVVTGCGFKPIEHIFEFGGKPTHENLPIKGVDYKMNIGTAIAYYLTRKGKEVTMVSRNNENLQKIKEGLVNLGCKENLISYIPGDLDTSDGTTNLIKNLPKDRNIYWVQSMGMGGGSYKIPNDNIYLPFEQISPELISEECNIVPATHRLMLNFMPIFRKQIKNGNKAKIAMITSMSGERGYYFGATHVAAKHALVGYIKGIEQELKDEGIEIYDIRPGAIDTGMYDNPHVQKSCEIISRKSNMWEGHKPIFRSPSDVAKKVYHALFSENPKKVYRILAPLQN